jgi:transposase
MATLDDDHQHGAQRDWHGDRHHHQHGAQGDRGEYGEAGGIRRIEVITGRERRRRWSREEKARITALSFEPDANVSEVARRNGVSVGLLHHWRRRAREQARSGEEAFRFVPVVTTTAGEQAGGVSRADNIELELHGTRIRLNGRVDQANLMAVLSAVRATV